MNWYIPGMGYQENFLPHEQKKLGHEVEIITSDRIPEFEGYDKHIGKIHKERKIGIGIFEDNGIKIHRLPCYLEFKNFGQILMKSLYKKIIELKPDIVQIHGAFTFAALQLIFYSCISKNNMFIDDHTNVDNFYINTIPKKLYVFFVKYFYKIFDSKVNCYMPVTYASMDLLKSILRIPDKKTVLLPLGADTNKFKPNQESRKIIQKELKIDNMDFLILTSGKFDKKKDIEILIKAFANLNKVDNKIKLLLLGNGSNNYLNKLNDLIESLNIENKIILHDFVPNNVLSDFYNCADIGVWPGDNSITVLEAVATGLPVIIPISDLSYKILFLNKAALGFKRGNEKDLTEKINILINNQKMRNDFIKQSQKLAKNVISWNELADKSIRIYDKYT